MNTFPLTVSTPDGNRFKGEVAGVMLRGIEGELAVLAGHIPFITSVKAGKCKLTFADGTEKIAETEAGLLTVGEKSTTLLTGSFELKE